MRFISFLLLVSQIQPLTSTWGGRLAIGSVVYELVATSRQAADGTVHFSLQISAGGAAPVRTLQATLQDGKGEVVIDGVRSALEPSIAAAWRRQLRTGIGSELSSNEFICRAEADGRVCDSRTVVRLNDSLSGRVRMIYNGGRIRGIRFFSLAEWINPFGEYVSLSLDIR